MRSQSYGDKQRDAQRQKKQEEAWKQSNPETAPPSETAKADKSDQPPNKTKKKESPKKESPVRRSA